jgi:hypothetical protein
MRGWDGQPTVQPSNRRQRPKLTGSVTTLRRSESPSAPPFTGLDSSDIGGRLLAPGPECAVPAWPSAFLPTLVRGESCRGASGGAGEWAPVAPEFLRRVASKRALAAAFFERGVCCMMVLEMKPTSG